jgi:acetolactate synthase-1/2/3 large subunit
MVAGSSRSGLKAHGVSHLFTLSGGHLFSIYDGCREEGIAIVDTRHEQSAAFAAEGWAKATRTPGVCALTAGPGVTNGMSALGSALKNNSPLLVLGGRAPAMRWGQGSLQEIDHVPVRRAADEVRAHGGREPPRSRDSWTRRCVPRSNRPPARRSSTSRSTTSSWRASRRPHQASCPIRSRCRPPTVSRRRSSCCVGRSGRRSWPGTGLYWAHGEHALTALCEELQIPVLLNGLARGCVAADHPSFLSRARSAALKGADVALVVGVPMDFRLGFGGSFGEDTKIVVIGQAPPEHPHPREVACELYGGVAATLDALRQGAAGDRTAAGWLSELRGVETRSAPPSARSWRTTARRCIPCASTASSSR